MQSLWKKHAFYVGGVFFPNQALLLGFLLAIEEEPVRIDRATGSPGTAGPVPPGCRASSPRMLGQFLQDVDIAIEIWIAGWLNWNRKLILKMKLGIEFENEIEIELNSICTKLNWIESNWELILKMKLGIEFS